MTDSQSPPDRKQQLLDVARAQFVANGYAKTPVSAIVAGAGVAQGTFYLYFQSKQAVLAELRREVFHDYGASLEHAARHPGPADERLVAILVAMVQAVERNQALERVFRTAESADATQRAALDGRQRLASRAAELLSDGRAAGVFAPATDPLLTAQLIITLFDNVLYEAIVYARPAPVWDLLPTAVQFTLRALGVSEARIDALLTRIPDPKEA